MRFPFPRLPRPLGPDDAPDRDIGLTAVERPGLGARRARQRVAGWQAMVDRLAAADQAAQATSRAPDRARAILPRPKRRSGRGDPIRLVLPPPQPHPWRALNSLRLVPRKLYDDL